MGCQPMGPVKMAALSGQRPVGMSVKGFWAKSADFNWDFRSLGTMHPEMAPFFCIFQFTSFPLVCNEGVIRKT